MAAAFVVLPAAALALSGCSQIGDAVSEEVGEQIGEEIIEQAGGEGVDIEIDEEGGQIDIETDDGSISFGGGELPDGFPVDLVPVVDGEIVTASRADNDSGVGYIVGISVEGSFDEVNEEALALLEDAGLETVLNTNAGEFATYGFEDTDEISGVTLQVYPNDDETVFVGYSVQVLD